MRAAVGFPVIYYAAGRTRHGGVYYGFAVVRGVHGVKGNPRVMWADVESYEPLRQEVLLQEEGLFIESAFQGINRRAVANADIRALPEDEGMTILRSSEAPQDLLPLQVGQSGTAVSSLQEYLEGADVAGGLVATGDEHYRVRSERVRALLRQIAITRYDGRCIFTSRRQSLGKGRFLADAAHIFPLGRGGPDCIENTALMCPAIHRLYDYGLIALSDDYRILTKDSLSEDYRKALNHDGHATLPQDKCLWPSIEMVRAHRREIFGASS